MKQKDRERKKHQIAGLLRKGDVIKMKKKIRKKI